MHANLSVSIEILVTAKRTNHILIIQYVLLVDDAFSWIPYGDAYMLQRLLMTVGELVMMK